MSNSMPKSWNSQTKPHKFCPGCGQALAMKMLGFAIDELGIQDKMVYATDIGCSLLSWDMFNVDTIQTHHGRTIPVAVGFKLAKPDGIVVGLLGDGGGYAIGAQHLVNAAMRNDKITLILINNANYAMTGGQLAPTTLMEQPTTTTPQGRRLVNGHSLKGPEMISAISSDNSYIARGSTDDCLSLKNLFKKAIQNQIDGRGFSFVEVLSLCPINWKTDAKESFEFLNRMKETYSLGEIKVPKSLTENQ